MKLKDLLKDVEYELIKGDINIELDDIAYNSKLANENTGFVALTGFRVDGHDYIDNAISNGCKCIFVEKDVKVDKDITVVKLNNTRLDLAKLSRTLFRYPDKELTTIAITGTKGKTTTSFMIKKILDDCGNKCGLIGTIGIFYSDKYFHTVNTSPESYDVFKHMRSMINDGIKYMVMEVSSQSLKLKRWQDIIFDYAVFTNLSLDHVGTDEHDSFDDYKYCKSLLFKQCKYGIFNSDSEYYSYMSNGCSGDIITYGKNNDAMYKLGNVTSINKNGFIGIDMAVSGKINSNFRVSIPGYFTSYNAIAAITVCDLLGINIDSIKKSLESVSVKGRMESIKISNKFSLIIDYAYQGIAMENVLSTIKETNPKRIVTVFGCGGNRSRQRRFDCGEVSGKYADLSIITSDNPRYEKNEDIVKDILVGMEKTSGKYIIIHDRREAIKYSIVNAKEGDVILLLGKGHEDYQIINGETYPFDERVVIKDIINELSNEDVEKLGIVR